MINYRVKWIDEIDGKKATNFIVDDFVDKTKRKNIKGKIYKSLEELQEDLPENLKVVGNPKSTSNITLESDYNLIEVDYRNMQIKGFPIRNESNKPHYLGFARIVRK